MQQRERESKFNRIVECQISGTNVMVEMTKTETSHFYFCPSPSLPRKSYDRVWAKLTNASES